MDLLAFAEWCSQTRLALLISESTWAFAVIESIHLLGLSVIGGMVLIVDLRLLGLGLKSYPVRNIGRDVWPWQNGALVLMLVTGVLLFLSEATKCYYSTPFWWKMGALIASIAFLYGVKRRVVFSDPPRDGTAQGALVALVSLTLWFVVGASGRWIGFSG
jgi:hypothetical protein